MAAPKRSTPENFLQSYDPEYEKLPSIKADKKPKTHRQENFIYGELCDFCPVCGSYMKGYGTTYSLPMPHITNRSKGQTRLYANLNALGCSIAHGDEGQIALTLCSDKCRDECYEKLSKVKLYKTKLTQV